MRSLLFYGSGANDIQVELEGSQAGVWGLRRSTHFNALNSETAMEDLETRLTKRTGLSLDEALALIEDGIDAGVKRQEALQLAQRMEDYVLA